MTEAMSRFTAWPPGLPGCARRSPMPLATHPGYQGSSGVLDSGYCNPGGSGRRIPNPWDEARGDRGEGIQGWHDQAS
jgi:hypothetical protein